jgi:hypothetical protein
MSVSILKETKWSLEVKRHGLCESTRTWLRSLKRYCAIILKIVVYHAINANLISISLMTVKTLRGSSSQLGRGAGMRQALSCRPLRQSTCSSNIVIVTIRHSFLFCSFLIFFGLPQRSCVGIQRQTRSVWAPSLEKAKDGTSTVMSLIVRWSTCRGNVVIATMLCNSFLFCSFLVFFGLPQRSCIGIQCETRTWWFVQWGRFGC